MAANVAAVIQVSTMRHVLTEERDGTRPPFRHHAWTLPRKEESEAEFYLQRSYALLEDLQRAVSAHRADLPR